jgi:hypothetical protein
MSTTVLVALTTGGFTLLAALGGTFFSLRHARKMAEMAQVNERRDEVRGIIVDLIQTGSYWAMSMEAVVRVLGSKVTTAEANSFLSDLPKQDIGMDLHRHVADLARTLTAADLLIGDAVLLTHVSQVRVLFDESEQHTYFMILTSIDKGSDAIERIRSGLDYLNKFRNAIDEVEQRARVLFRSKLA